MTSDTSKQLRFWAHRKLARSVFHDRKILFPDQFDEVDWHSIYYSLQDVPRMFSVWACKQVNDIAPTNLQQSYYKKDHNKKCPSCEQADETCCHVLTCEEAGRVDALHKSINNFDQWLKDHNTDAGLRRVLVEYARGRGGMTMFELTRSLGPRFYRLAASQDKIGWRRFMEGMISKEIVPLYAQHYNIRGGKLRPEAWGKALVVKLLEITHGQWLYRNIQVHDTATGIYSTQRKEKLQQLIEDQIELGGEGLDDDDLFLLEINLEDLESSSGETQEYWLLAIEAARESRRLRLQTQTASVQQSG